MVADTITINRAVVDTFIGLLPLLISGTVTPVMGEAGIAFKLGVPAEEDTLAVEQVLADALRTGVCATCFYHHETCQLSDAPWFLRPDVPSQVVGCFLHKSDLPDRDSAVALAMVRQAGCQCNDPQIIRRPGLGWMCRHCKATAFLQP